MKKIGWLGVPLLCIGLCVSLFLTSSAVASGKGYIPGRFILKLSSGARLTGIRQSLAAGVTLTPLVPAPLRVSLSSTLDWSRYVVFQTGDTNATVASVRAEVGSANIEYLEQDQYLDFYDYPADSLFSNQWYLVNNGQEYLGVLRQDGSQNDQQVLKSGAAGADMKIRRFYEHPPSDSTPVVVGVVDTGTDPLHPELAGRLWRNPDEIPDNGVDDDHNGYVDDTIGYDISGDTPAFFDIQGDNDVSDYFGHGTHIAGIIAANADGRGIAGIAPWAKIMSIKIRPNGFLSIGTAGVLYAINNGAKVINISWGTPFEALILEDALNFARQNNVFVAIAAGNTGDNTRANPAAMDSAFSVGAGNSAGFMAPFSTWGPFVDIVAPGVDILSLRASGTDMYAESDEPGVHIVGADSLYYLADGTSMAAPMVAGAAAFIWGFKPQLTLKDLENALRFGADDMVDPRDQGDTLIGPDSVSGYGYLDVARAFDLALAGGMALVSPPTYQRYSGAVPVKAIAIGGYADEWVLEYSYGFMSESWQPLASGTGVPADSLLGTFNQPGFNGWINLRLTDKNGNSGYVRFVYVNSDVLNLAFPQEMDTLRYSIQITGTACGVSYDSVAVSYRFGARAPVKLFSTTHELFDTVFTVWNASGVASGLYTVYLRGYYGFGELTDSATIFVASSFATGWPKTLPSTGSQSVVAADLDHDGHKEIIAGSAYGLFAYDYSGHLLPGFPILPNKDMRCMPAVYDIDGDGQDDIITTNQDGLHVFRRDGSEMAGWPKLLDMGPATAFGYPSPSIISPVKGKPPIIMFINGYGEVFAFRFNGDPYFYSLGGFYSYFSAFLVPVYFYAGNSVSAADLDGDGQNEVVAGYTGLYPKSGVAAFEGRTGRPAFGAPGPQVIDNQLLCGSVLADLNGDSLPEIIATGQDSVYGRVLYVKTKNPDGTGMVDAPGFPKRFPEALGWIGTFPTVADLDLDGVPEILCTFFEFDIAVLYIFRADGTAYHQVEGKPEGEAFSAPVTFGNPIVANITGDEYPEIVIRAGYILPGTGAEQLFMLDHTGVLMPGFPITTPANKKVVMSSMFSPLVDDIDGDGLVEVALPGDNGDIYVWDFDAPSLNGKNTGRLLMDNRNSNIWRGPSIATDVPDEPGSLPLAWQLGQNYPNPFNPTTTIRFTVPRKSHVTLELFNILGQRAATLVDEEMAAGGHQVTVDATHLASGIYLYRLSADDYTATRKMVLLK